MFATRKTKCVYFRVFLVWLLLLFVTVFFEMFCLILFYFFFSLFFSSTASSWVFAVFVLLSHTTIFVSFLLIYLFIFRLDLVVFSHRILSFTPETPQSIKLCSLHGRKTKSKINENKFHYEIEFQSTTVLHLNWLSQHQRFCSF